MTRILALLLLVAVISRADEIADRLAIHRTIAALNEHPARDDIFTAGADGRQLIERLRIGKSSVMQLPIANVPLPCTAPCPSLTISREPWGEATINWPFTIQFTDPLIAINSIRFVTAEVALVDGAFVHTKDGEIARAPLLFVMQKENESWKIASVRKLGEP